MDLNIVISTQDRTLKVQRLLSSLEEADITRVIIVCDSENQMMKLQSRLNLIVVGQHKLEELKKKIGNDKVLCWVKESYNLGGKRSIGALYSYSFSGTNGYTLFLDDDMVFDGFRFKPRQEHLMRLNLKGCPDLSRLEWLQLHNGYKEGYIGKMLQALEGKERHLISKYTDLLAGCGSDIEFPQRNELSGGAFACHNSILHVSKFPNWFDEDWYWFYKIRTIKKLAINNSGLHAYHDSSMKDIFNEEKLMFEEDGKILTGAMKMSGDITSIRKCRQDRVEILTKMKQKTPEVIEPLKRLINYLLAKDVMEYVNEIEHFKTINERWRNNFFRFAEYV